MVLENRDIIFSEMSMVDDFGKVFFYESRVFRAISKHSEEHCKLFLESPLYKILYERGYIPKTWKANYELEDFSLVLEHEFIDKSEPHHWSFNMYKDAILLILETNKICNEYGYQLKDSHPYNVFFKNNRPIFIDLGSIVKIAHKSSWIAYDQYLNYCYLQLLIWAKGDFFLARKLLEDGNSPYYRTIPMTQILDSPIIDFVASDLAQFNLLVRGKSLLSTSKRYNSLAFVCKLINKPFKLIFPEKCAILSYTRQFKNIEFVEQQIKGIKRPQLNSTWQNYHSAYSENDEIISTLRFEKIVELVKQNAADIKTSIDLAGNQGVFCYLLSQQIDLDRVVLTDYDENAIDKAYLLFKKKQNKIQPYLFNFMIPLRRDEISYLKSDIAFALAITHHLLLAQKYYLPAIFRKIKEYSNKYVVIEFMPLGLWTENVISKVPGWYTLEWFRKEFEKHFVLLKEEKLEVNRIVFIGKNI